MSADSTVARPVACQGPLSTWTSTSLMPTPGCQAEPATETNPAESPRAKDAGVSIFASSLMGAFSA